VSTTDRRTATIVVGLAAAAYLFIGSVLVTAYTTAQSYDGLHFYWSKFPVTALFLVPGVVLAVATAFLRSHRSAIITAALLLVAVIPLAAPRLVFYLRLMYLIRRVGISGCLYLLIYGGGLALVLTALIPLWRHWRTFRTPARRARGAFEVVNGP
jgi:hypothetical protein